MNEKPNDDENKTSKYSLMAVPENFSEDEISEVESPTNLITDQPSHDQEVKLEHINLERIKEVDSEAEAENHVDKMSNENCEMSEKILKLLRSTTKKVNSSTIKSSKTSKSMSN